MISKRNVKKFCCDDISLIENYDKAINDNVQTWQCHHRLETHNSDGERRLVDITSDELIALDMYYKRPASELIFMKVAEHRQLHLCGKTSPKKGKPGHKLSEETKEKIRHSHYGIKSSEETRKKLSEAAKTCRNGMKWYNNGSVETYGFECPEGFVLGRLTKEERRKRGFNAIANSWLGYNAEYDKKVEESK